MQTIARLTISIHSPKLPNSSDSRRRGTSRAEPLTRSRPTGDGFKHGKLQSAVKRLPVLIREPAGVRCRSESFNQ